MKAWKRAERVVACGLCGRLSGIGDPVLVIVVGEKIKLIRCAQCVGPAPPDLPDEIVREATPTPRGFTRPLPYGRIVDRDPGEEG